MGLYFPTSQLPPVIAVLILMGTVLLVAWRPWIVSEGVVALGGALLMVATGWAVPSDIWETAQATSGIMLFLIGMMIVAVVADEAGFFEWAAERTVRAARGRGRLLYVLLYLLGAAITLFLSLDVTAIIFTPIVCASALRLRLNPIPFVFASAFVANTASLALPVSNLTNMLVFNLLGVDFWSFVRYLAVPNLAAMGLNLVVFLFLFRSDIPRRFSRPEIGRVAPNRRFLFVAGMGIGVVIAGLLAAGFFGWPLHVVALAGAIALGGVGLGWRQVRAATLWRGVAWQLPLFVVGMYIVVVGVNRAVLAPLLSDILQLSQAEPGLGVLILAFGTGLGANLVNNIPMSLVAITALGAAPGTDELFSLATVIGTNLGPNVTVFGSLATMLVLTSARQRGIRISAGRYLRVGLLTTPPMILVASLLLLVTARGA